MQNTESPDNTSSKNDSETKIQFKESEPTIESTVSLLPEEFRKEREISRNLMLEQIEDETEIDHDGQQEGKLVEF